MVSVSNFSDFVGKASGCYALVPTCSTVDIFLDTPSGRVSIDGYDAYLIPEGTLLSFDKIDRAASEWSYDVVLDGENHHTLQWQTFEEVYEPLTGKEPRPHQFLSFLKSVDTGTHSLNGLVEDRCDMGSFGPTTYHLQDGINESTFDPTMLKPGSLKDYRTVLSVNGVAHISIQEVWPIYMSWRNWPMVCGVSKTMTGMLKQISEWASLYEAGLSSDDIARDAASFIQQLGITEEMISQINEVQEDMAVFRFMKGALDARHGYNEVLELPSDVENMLRAQMRFETLSALSKNHPSHPVFESSLLEVEVLDIEQYLYSFVLMAFPDREPESVSIDEIKNALPPHSMLPFDVSIEENRSIVENVNNAVKRYSCI